MTSIAGYLWARRAPLALGLTLVACLSRLDAVQPAGATDLAVRFAPAAGTFVERETVALSVDGDASIHFTLDGSVPTATSPMYEKPLALDASTRVRAVAIARGVPRSPVASESYLRVSPDTQHFTSHLPIIVIHTFESGVPSAYGTDYLPAVLQVFEPVAGVTRVVGRATLEARIGIHVRGQSTRRFPKKQYAIELRADGDDADLPRPLLGLPSDADWVLSDSIAYDRSLIRNAVAFSLSNRIGRYAPRTRFAEAFMVDDGGDVRAESFVGVFTLIEKISRGPQRVDVTRLPASAAQAPESTGGFILRIDKGFADFFAGGSRLQFVYPSAAAMRLPERKSQFDFIRAYLDDFAQAVRAPDFVHPTTRQPYSAFIDVDAWIDHHVINTLAKNVDGLRFSAYLHKDRGGRLAAGPLWDFDRSFGTPYDPRAAEPEEWSAAWSDATDYFAQGWWWYVFRDPAFRSRYRERFTALLNGEFSVESLDGVVDATASQLGDAAGRNFRRWPQTPPKDDSHAAEIAVMKAFLRRRVAWIKTQLAANF